jgi:hypothetical protein
MKNAKNTKQKLYNKYLNKILMKLIFLITIITLISLSKESTVLNFQFPKTLYVKDILKKSN